MGKHTECKLECSNVCLNLFYKVHWCNHKKRIEKKSYRSKTPCLSHHGFHLFFKDGQLGIKLFYVMLDVNSPFKSA